MNNYNFDYSIYTDMLVQLFEELQEKSTLSAKQLAQLVKKYTKDNGDVFSKDQLVLGYKGLAGTHGLKPFDERVLKLIQMKPVRTVSGVAPITVLTKPFPCPGKCIFCPNDIRMPKSYLSDEPGAQRAERNFFDPYLQTYNRLQALSNIGHTIDKAEVIVLGGTWSYYPEAYQIWFIKECFRALNDFGTKDDRAVILEKYEKMEKKLKEMDAHAPTNVPEENEEALKHKNIHGNDLNKTYNVVVSETYVAPERIAGFDKYQMANWKELFSQQKENETATTRCVGLVVETRPDNISEQEVIRIRKLGCTKTQIGFQSLQDEVLTKNKRGHNVQATRNAVRLLRQAGFKIHAHWMPNLYGSSVELDKQDYELLFNDPDFKPDELKVYPCSLIESAELMQYYKNNLWQPYTYDELLDVLSFALMNTPEYCRLTRIVRDIPSTDIVEGNKLTNFRQIAETSLEKVGQASRDIRSREIRNEEFDEGSISFETVEYETNIGKEVFLQYTALTKKNKTKKLLGFLRLSLPTQQSYISELKQAAVIREVHVYGQVVGLGDKDLGKAQHLGLGGKLILAAKEMATQMKYKKIAVISAIGTKEYYRKQGFSDGELYQFSQLT